MRTEKAIPEKRTTSAGKVIPILMPQAGNTMEEGTVLSWRVKEGDQIVVGQVICEIETDKATMDFESPDAGRLARIVAQVGEPVAVKEHNRPAWRTAMRTRMRIWRIKESRRRIVRVGSRTCRSARRGRTERIGNRSPDLLPSRRKAA